MYAFSVYPNLPRHDPTWERRFVFRVSVSTRPPHARVCARVNEIQGRSSVSPLGRTRSRLSLPREDEDEDRGGQDRFTSVRERGKSTSSSSFPSLSCRSTTAVDVASLSISGVRTSLEKLGEERGRGVGAYNGEEGGRKSCEKGGREEERKEGEGGSSG